MIEELDDVEHTPSAMRRIVDLMPSTKKRQDVFEQGVDMDTIAFLIQGGASTQVMEADILEFHRRVKAVHNARVSSSRPSRGAADNHCLHVLSHAAEVEEEVVHVGDVVQ